MTGFDYYNARYYDPVMAQFLSADVKQGNAQGMDPYSYVAGNPETATDPTGQAGVCAWCGDTGIAPGSTAASGSYPTAPKCPSGEIVTGTPCSTPGIKGGGGGSTAVMLVPHGSGGGKNGAGAGVNTSLADPQTGGCDTTCGNSDRQYITDYINAQRTHDQNVHTFGSDLASIVGDVVGLIADFSGGAWAGGIIDALSLIIHLAVVGVDLQNLGIHNFSISANVASWIGFAKSVINIADEIKGALDLFANGLKGLLKVLIPHDLAKKITAGIADAVVGGASGALLGLNYYDDATHYDDALQAVGKYSDQQAHDICLQDYGSQAQICQ